MTRTYKHPLLIPLAAFLVLFIVLAFIFYHDFLFQYPYSTHAWAQADRLALALSYYNKGMNFFMPATYNQWSLLGIATPELPIQSYISAALGFIVGKEHISTIYRLLTLSICIAGLWFLFLSGYKTQKDSCCRLLHRYLFSVFLYTVSTPAIIFPMQQRFL